MDELTKFRQEIDAIDKAILDLFIKRMEAVDKIAEFKMANDMIVYDQAREDEVIKNNLENCKSEEYRPYYQEILEVILRVSKEYQKQIIIRSTL